MKRLWCVLPVVLLVAVGLAAGNALGQNYPSKPVRLVVNMPAGGGVDVVSRLIGQKLTDAWKQPVLIDNRGGAGGNIGADAVAKAAPDGYTLLVTTSSLAISPNIYRKLPFDALKDFAPVSQIYTSFLILVVNANVPAASVKELVALAKSRPGKLNYGHSGVGSTLHLTMELFKISAGVDILAIPYKGTAPISTALLTGEVDVAFMAPEAILAHIDSGKVRALATASRARLRPLPKVPTMEEAGVRDFELPGWLGIYAPAGTPRDIVELIQRDTVKVLNLPDVRNRIITSGQEPVGSTPEEFDVKHKTDLARFATIIKELRIPLQD